MKLPIKSPPTILVFDSGAGGLSIAKEIIDTTPDCQLIFAADKGFFPYGLKSDEVLTHRIVSQIELLHQQYKPDIVVIACNTASTLALDILRQDINCPIVGVVPAIKPAASITRSGVIGVLATAATIKRGYTQKLIEDFASDLTVLLYGSTGLAEIAENKITEGNVDSDRLKAELDQLFNQPQGNRIDTVVLACTHFPLLIEDMDAIIAIDGRKLTWVDSGKAIARRVQMLLNTNRNNADTEVKRNALRQERTKINFVFLGENLNYQNLELKYLQALQSARPPI